MRASFDLLPDDTVARVTSTYISGDNNQGIWIICLTCGLRSYNPNDVAQRYCGRCHKFHEDFWR